MHSAIIVEADDWLVLSGDDGEPKNNLGRRGPKSTSERSRYYDPVSDSIRKSRTTLDEGVLVVSGDASRSEFGIVDAEELAWEIRRRAIQAHAIVNGPDAQFGELLKVQRQFDELLRAARSLSSRPTELECWLRNAILTIAVKLRSCLAPVPGG